MKDSTSLMTNWDWCLGSHVDLNQLSSSLSWVPFMLILLKGKWFCPASDCGCASLYVLLSCSQWSWYWGGLPFQWLLNDDTQTGYLAIAWSETSLLFPIHWVHYLFHPLLKDLVEDLARHWQKHNSLVVLQFLRSSFFGSIMRMLSFNSSRMFSSS